MLAKEKDLDAVIIATPDSCHALQAIACMQAGLDVYCETPMANTIADARKMLQTAKRTNTKLQIGLQRRSNPRYRFCCEKLIAQANLLNRITNISGQLHQGIQDSAPKGWPHGTDIDPTVLTEYGYASMDELVNWRRYKKYSVGPFAAAASHQLDVYNWFLGNAKPVSVIACANNGYWSDSQWPDSTIAILQYATPPGTVRATYETITTNSSRGCFEQFMGDQATLMISQTIGRSAIYREAWLDGNFPRTKDDFNNWIDCVDTCVVLDTEGHHDNGENGGSKSGSTINLEPIDSRQTDKPPKYDIPIRIDTPTYLPHIKNFCDVIRGRGALNCPAELAFRTLTVALKINEAAITQQKLEFTAEDFQA